MRFAVSNWKLCAVNPILSREIRLRWRDLRSFWLLFALTAMLCGGATWIYHEQNRPRQIPIYPTAGVTWQPVGSKSESTEARVHRTGRELFRSLAIGNALAWLLIAPALTATGLARERERGLLESLQLSQMTMRSQIAARYGAALAFLLILQIATLPVYGTAILLGGVSPGELGASALIIALGAATGAAIGLFFSARAARPSSALFAALAAIGIWSGLAVYFLGFLDVRFGLINSSGEDVFYHILAFSHPIALLSFLTKPGNYCGPTGCLLPFNFTLLGAAVLQITATSLLLRQTTRDSARQLPPTSFAGRNRWVEKRKKAREIRLERAKIEAQSVKRGEKIEGALLADLPLEKLVKFQDPILAREVKSRFRLRRGTFWVGLLRLGVFLGGAGLWLWGAFSIFDRQFRPDAAFNILFSVAIPGVLAVGVLAGQSFVRERESGTWEGVRLSLLSAGHIVRAKWLSPLISCAYYGAPLWILLPFAVEFRGAPFVAVFPAFTVVLTALFFAGALGLWISWRAKNAASATCWTLGLLFGLWGAAPYVWQNFGLEDRALGALTGVNRRLLSDAYTYNYEGSELVQIYERETGKKSDGPFSGDYWNWIQEKGRQTENWGEWTRFWSPLSTLEKLRSVSDPNRRNNYSYNYYYSDNRQKPDENAQTLAFFNALALGLATLFLLWDLRRRIEKSREI